ASAGAGSNRVVFGGTGTSTVDIRNNTLKGSKGEAIRVRSTGQASGLRGTVNARVRNNTIGEVATNNSGSTESNGILIFSDGGSSMTAAVTNNIIRLTNNNGIFLNIGDEINNGAVNNITVTGNSFST